MGSLGHLRFEYIRGNWVMNILVAGGTGFIGEYLVSQLKNRGHQVVLLSRRDKISTDSSVRCQRWDGKSLDAWADYIETSDAVINLAGTPIADKRWSSKRKADILNSRVDSTKIIIEAIKKATKKPKVLINASAVGYYGNVPDGDVVETSPRGNGFLSDTCALWEKEATVAEQMGVRTVLLRMGIVLAHGGGALSKMLLAFQLFAGGSLGSGRQWFPWIHRDDVVGAILFSLENVKIKGPVNVTAPNPVTMHDFCSELGRRLHRPSWLPVPGVALHLVLGEMSSMLLEGQRAIPKKLLDQKYCFEFVNLNNALIDILRNQKSNGI
ncbi:MAG: hypothetical protein ACI9CF_001604 [Candidatus Omnitrophota bacterium]|jgi:uncharacterized protein (TIGR01777 family)